MTRQGWWVALGVALFLFAWAVALLGAPQGEYGRVILSSLLALGGLFAFHRSGVLE